VSAPTLRAEELHAHARGPRRIAAPRPVPVRADGEERPLALGSTAVDAIREEWLVEDRWWTGRPVRRRYFELVLVDGRDVVVFRDLVGGAWKEQRA
jgi:hypothetical protein